FVVYKLPSLIQSDFARDGTGMAYMDSQLSRWLLLNATIDELHQPVAYTLNQIYSRMDSFLYLLYNDDTPGERKQSSYRAHAKGALAFDRKTGFWLVHTIPRYPPPAREGYTYPKSASINGQVMLCLSLNSDQLEKIGLQMDYMRPQVYDSFSSNDFAVEHKSIWAFVKGAKKVVDEDFSNMETLTTMAGTKIVSFAKSRNFGKDLYEDLISPTLRNNLLVQSWMNGQKNLNSACKVKYTVKNIKTLDFDGMAFKSSKDHSKWAMDFSENDRWFCIGDINRQASQATRGGGALCIRDDEVWKGFHDSIRTVEGCDGQEVPADQE
ncbi:hypothetical protein HELRODRAFT_65498, partial [Helobdella robusta]|uniref:Uncharacterized protein n=1 Tax=Helobdella robusta TaxID=6412 RepID=T1FY88_HELRO